MRSFLILLAVASYVAADIGITAGTGRVGGGYHYDAPQSSYGAPTYQKPQALYDAPYSSGSQFSSQSTGGYNGGASSGGFSSGQSSGGFSGGLSSGGFSGAGQQTGGNYYSGSSNQGFQYQQPAVQYSAGNGGVSNQYQTSQQFQTASVQKYQESYSQQQPAQVFKHFYVHAAPEEPEQPQFRQPQVLPAPQKHYKIIFIKTPAQQAAQQQVIQQQQPHEEKTIVYVLTPKAEQVQQTIVQQAAPKAPTKPEVFFIKYKGKEGSQAVIDNIVQNYNQGQGQSGSVSYNTNDVIDATGISGGSQGGSSGFGGQAGSSGFGGQATQSFGQQTVGFGGFGTAGSESASQGFQASAGSNAVVQNDYSGSTGGDLQSIVSASQSVPHETYGTPNFRS